MNVEHYDLLLPPQDNELDPHKVLSTLVAKPPSVGWWNAYYEERWLRAERYDPFKDPRAGIWSYWDGKKFTRYQVPKEHVDFGYGSDSERTFYWRPLKAPFFDKGEDYVAP
jgi:hypothetical protein